MALTKHEFKKMKIIEVQIINRMTATDIVYRMKTTENS